MKAFRLGFVLALLTHEVTCQWGRSGWNWPSRNPSNPNVRCDYRCIGSANCATESQKCDRYRHCPAGDDEDNCLTFCPSSCSCSTLPNHPHGYLHTICTDGWTRATVAGISRTTDLMELSGGCKSKPGILQYGTFSRHNDLSRLNLRNNSIETIQHSAFAGLSALQHLDISNNLMTRLDTGSFWGIIRLVTLTMENTPVTYAEEDAFEEFYQMKEVTLDYYLICCSFESNVICNSVRPVYLWFDCGTIMKSHLGVRFPFTIFITALMIIFNYMMLACHNKHVFVGKRKFKDPEDDVCRVQSLWIWNLNLSGLMMAGYLVSIIFAHVKYGSEYCFHSKEWINSVQCIGSGFLFFTSMEATIMILVFVSVDQYIKFNNLSTGKKIPWPIAARICLSIWCGAVIFGLLGAVSLLTSSDLHDLSRFCIGLPLYWRPGGLNVRGNTINPLKFLAPLVVLFNIACYVTVLHCYKFVGRVQKRLKRKTKLEQREEEKKLQKEEEIALKEEEELSKERNTEMTDTEENGEIKTVPSEMCTHGDAYSKDKTTDAEVHGEKRRVYRILDGSSNVTVNANDRSQSNGSRDETDERMLTYTTDGDKMTRIKEGHVINEDQGQVNGSPMEDKRRQMGGYDDVGNDTTQSKDMSHDKGITREQSETTLSKSNEEKGSISNDQIRPNDDGQRDEEDSETESNINHEYVEGNDGKENVAGCSDELEGKSNEDNIVEAEVESDQNSDVRTYGEWDWDEDEEEDPRTSRTIQYFHMMIYIPVMSIALLSQFRVPIPAEVYWWLQVFIIPLSSAITPILILILTGFCCQPQQPLEVTSEEYALTAYEQAMKIL